MFCFLLSPIQFLNTTILHDFKYQISAHAERSRSFPVQASAKSPPVKNYLTVEIAKFEAGSFWFDQSEWTKEPREKEKITQLLTASTLAQLQSGACTPLRPKLWFTNTVEPSPQKSPSALSNLPLRMNGPMSVTLCKQYTQRLLNYD